MSGVVLEILLFIYKSSMIEPLPEFFQFYNFESAVLKNRISIPYLHLVVAVHKCALFSTRSSDYFRLSILDE